MKKPSDKKRGRPREYSQDREWKAKQSDLKEDFGVRNPTERKKE